MVRGKDFRRKLRKLKNFSGVGKTLVSIYSPYGQGVSTIQSFLKSEINESRNIKSSQTRKGISRALEMIRQYLKAKSFEDLEEAYAIFAGSQPNGDEIMEFFPLQNSNLNIYRCGSIFSLEPLEEQLKPKDIYGIVSIEVGEMTFGYYDGNSVITVETMASLVPGKHGMGGQSSNRFARDLARLKRDYFKQCSAKITSCFRGLDNFQGILMGGPTITLEEFSSPQLLPEDMSLKVLSKIGMDLGGEVALRKILELSEEKIVENKLLESLRILEESMDFFQKHPYPELRGGVKSFCDLLNRGMIKKAIINKDHPEEVILKTCEVCSSETLEPRYEKLQKPKVCCNLQTGGEMITLGEFSDFEWKGVRGFDPKIKEFKVLLDSFQGIGIVLNHKGEGYLSLSNRDSLI